MKLIELFELITDESNVIIWDAEGTICERYSGKDSIDPKYNERETINISSGYYQIAIIIR